MRMRAQGEAFMSWEIHSTPLEVRLEIPRPSPVTQGTNQRGSEFHRCNVLQIMMMGSLEASVEEAQRIPENLPPVINDLDIEEEEVAIENRSEYLLKVNCNF